MINNLYNTTAGCSIVTKKEWFNYHSFFLIKKYKSHNKKVTEKWINKIWIFRR
jgi:hypothetical protein